MHRVLCSTGALIGRVHGYDYRVLDRCTDALACDGYELMLYPRWYDDITAVKRYVSKKNLFIPVVHCQKGIGELLSQGSDEEIAEAHRLFANDCATASDIGAEKLVLHLWGGLASDGKFEGNASAYPHLLETAQMHGLDLLIENVVCNVENPAKHLYDLYRRYPDIHFVYDTKMAAFHAQLDLLYTAESEWLWQENHIRHYHVNDYGGGYMDWSNLRTLPIGGGHVDFDRFFAFVRESGYSGDFTVEATAFNGEGTHDLAMLNTQFERIRAYLQ